MPRQPRRVATDEVQGPGSYVMVDCLTHGELERATSMSNLELLQRVREWNWTGPDGEVLPLPATEQTFALLTDWEMEYLARGLLLNRWKAADEAREKNSG